MTNEPITSRELAAAVEAFKDGHAALMKAMESGFASVRERSDGIEVDVGRLSEFALKQAEHNGFMKGRLEKNEEAIKDEKDRGDKHNERIIATMASALILLIGVIVTWFKH